MLDPDRPDDVRLSVADARALGEATLQRIGYPADEAVIITDQLIDNALCGYRFASLPRILAIAEDEKTGKPRAPVRVVRETPVSALVDGGNKVGYVAAYRGAEIAIAKASGIAIVGVHNSYYSGRNAIMSSRSCARGWWRSTPRVPSRTCCRLVGAGRLSAPTRSASASHRRTGR